MRKRKNFSATFFCPETIPCRYNAYSALIRTPSDCLQGQIRTYPQKMSPLTTITILVYELIKVNPTTRPLLAVRRQQHRQASRQKKSRQAAHAVKKKIQPTTERRKPARSASRTQHCQTVVQNTNVNKPDQAQGQQAIRCRKRGNLQRLWISHLISTG